MVQTLDDVLKSLPAARRRKIAARAKALIAEEASLQDLRKAMGKTQVEMAEALGVGQDAISRVEQRADMLISTLGDHVRVLGGELKLIAEFPGRPSVRLTGLAAIAGARSKKKSSRASPAPKRKRAAKRKSA